MSRGGTLWRGVMVAIVAVAATSCTTIVSTTHYKATIRVNGDDYSSDVVGQILSDGLTGKAVYSPFGNVMTFRLPDDRVIVVGTQAVWRERLRCVPRSDKPETECERRWSPYSTSHRRPDGYVFNDATDPTSAEAFQFEPRHPEFAREGYVELRNGNMRYQVPRSDLRLVMVAYSEKPSPERQPRDTLERDFPGYALTKLRAGRSFFHDSPIIAAANNIALPPEPRR